MMGNLDLDRVVRQFRAHQIQEKTLLKRDADLRRSAPGAIQGLRMLAG